MNHSGFQVLVLLLDLYPALVQLHIFVPLVKEENKKQKKKGKKCSVLFLLDVMEGLRRGSDSPASHQLVELQRHLLLLVQLLVLDVQHHLEALQLLLQIQSVGVLLWGPEPNRLGSHHLWTSTK